MKNCKHCKEEIPSDAKVCSHCGKKQKSTWIVIVIIIAIIGVIGAAVQNDPSFKAQEGNVNNNSQSGETTTTTAASKFTYQIDKQYVGDYDIGYYIEGFVKNNTNKEYSYIQIEFVCYDKDGNNLGTALDNSNNLLANQTWKFKAMFMGSNSKDVAKCEYHDITSW